MLSISSLKHFWSFAIVGASTCLLWAGQAHSDAHSTQEFLDREIEQYIGIYSTGERKTLKEANERLASSGISDERLFDVVVDQIDENSSNSRVAVLLVEALSYSGNPKYNASLRNIIDTYRNRSVTKAAAEALTTLATHQQWNPIISNNVARTNPERVDEQRVINMIRSGIPELEWAGAKSAFISHSLDEEVKAVSRETLAASYNKGVASGTHIDAMAYLIKVLIGDQESTALFEEIYHTAAHKKLKRYAEDALKRVGIKPG